MSPKERQNIKTLLLSEDQNIVKQGLFLWESLITDFDTFYQDLYKISARRKVSLYDKQALLSQTKLMKIFRNFKNKTYISFWTLGILTQFEEMKSQVLSFKKLHLLHLGLSEIPLWIEKMENIEEISFLSNEIDVLPEWIGYLSKLKKLDLAMNQLLNLPESIQNLKNLELLDLGHNPITQLPKHLTALKLDYHLFNRFKEEICDMTSLRYLNLQRNQLLELPENFGNLINLKILNLSYNKLEKLPTSFSNLENLEALNLGHNKIRQLPEDFGRLDGLRALNIGYNPLTNFPESFRYLHRLKKLSLPPRSYLKVNLKTIQSWFPLCEIGNYPGIAGA